MKRLTLTLLASLASILPVWAQTVEVPIGQLGTIIGGYSNANTGDNNLFVRSTAGSRQQDNAPTVTTTLVSPAVEGSAPTVTSQPVAGCWTTFIGGNGKLIPATNVNADCVPLSLNPGKGGASAVYATTSTPNAPTTVATCVRDSAQLGGFNPVTGTISVTQGSSTSDGAC